MNDFNAQGSEEARFSEAGRRAEAERAEYDMAVRFGRIKPEDVATDDKPAGYAGPRERRDLRLIKIKGLIEDGYTTADIAAEFGITDHGALNLLWRLGLNKMMQAKNRERKAASRAGKIEAIRTGIEAGETVYQIAAKFGMTAPSIYHFSRRNGIAWPGRWRSSRGK